MKWAKTILIVLVVSQLWGTAQMPDLLIYKSDTLAIFSNPLEVYFDQVGTRKLPKFKGCASTACWRGYVGIWELRNDSIFLKEVTSCHSIDCDDLVNADLGELFGHHFINNEVFADWISFEIRSPFGELIKYIHQGYESIYAYEYGFSFVDGILVSKNLYDNTSTHISPYTTDTKILHEFLYNNIDWDLVHSNISMEKKLVIAQFSVDDKGIPSDIEVVRGISTELDKEAIRVIQLIPRWDVYFRKGERVDVRWTLPISFDESVYQH